MSSSGIQSINSGPLIIRTYNQSVTTLSTTNTYLLGQYDTPIPSNYLLITTLNGQLAPTNRPTISSFNISTLNINNGYLSSFNASTIYTSSIICSTLIVSTSANIRYQTTTIDPLNSNINIDNTYWGKYIFVNPTNGTSELTLNTDGINTPYNGITMTFKNTDTTNPFSVLNIEGGTLPVNARSSIQVMSYNNIWYSV